MSSGIDCCQPCPVPQTVNIPGPAGIDGAAGAAGAPGVNAFTVTTANFQVPILGGNVTVQVANSTWMVPGQYIFVQGAGIFQVSSVPTSNSAILTYSNTGVNTATGATIVAGASVAPSGNPSSVIPGITSYAVGGSQALTAIAAQLLTASVTLASAGTYLLLAAVRFDLVVATFNASQTVTAKLRRTNNTPGDIANSARGIATGTHVATSATLAVAPLPPIIYTASAGDIVQIFGSIDVTPYSGAVEAIETSLVAIQLF